MININPGECKISTLLEKEKAIDSLIREMLLHLSQKVTFVVEPDAAYLGKYCGESNTIHIGLKGCAALSTLLNGIKSDITDSQLKVIKYIAAHELGHRIDQNIEATSIKANQAVKLANKAAIELDETAFRIKSEEFKFFMLKKEYDAWNNAEQYLNEDDDYDLFERIKYYCVATYARDCDDRRDKGLNYIKEENKKTNLVGSASLGV